MMYDVIVVIHATRWNTAQLLVGNLPRLMICGIDELKKKIELCFFQTKNKLDMRRSRSQNRRLFEIIDWLIGV